MRSDGETGNRENPSGAATALVRFVADRSSFAPPFGGFTPLRFGREPLAARDRQAHELRDDRRELTLALFAVGSAHAAAHEDSCVQS
jgi:hypothetical protein